MTVPTLVIPVGLPCFGHVHVPITGIEQWACVHSGRGRR